ncbi:hypothetical protein [Streptomyces sp. LX-29]|uniref:hypothetical protein n=1 Tax=Streptomyces sp. LX-29 TaxID=2900152 RepID=UPI00321C1877
MKSIFARSAPPPPSEGLLARLQALPAGGLADGRGPGEGGADGPGGSDGPFGGSGGFGVRDEPFAYLPAAAPTARHGGFRIHEVGRSSARGRRFAFAAAGAVSLAAFALSSALPVDAPAPSRGRAGGSDRSVSPADVAAPAADARQRGSRPGVFTSTAGGVVSPAHPPYNVSRLPASGALPPVVQPVLSASQQLRPGGSAEPAAPRQQAGPSAATPRASEAVGATAGSE